MNKEKEETGLVLAKDSDPELVKTYFTKILELKQSGKEFPINMNIVFSMAYNRKQEAVRVLKSDFIENVDYQALRRNAQRGAASPIDYYLTVECLEYFIAKKVKPVFEVYRRVFHKAIESNKPKQLSQNASELPEETPIVVKMGSGTNIIYIRQGVIFAKLAPISSIIGYYTTPTYYVSRWGDNCMKVLVGKQMAWFINIFAFTELIKQKGDVDFHTVRTIYKDVYRVEKEKDDENPFTYMFTNSEMLEIIYFLNQKPVNKGKVIDMLFNGKKEV